MIIYADRSLYQSPHRYSLNDIIKPFWSDRSPEERDQVYGDWVRGYQFTPSIDEADVVLLTYKWNYYVDHNLVSLARKEIDAARAHRKKVVVFSGGDPPANLTDPDVILFDSGYRSTQGLAYHSSQPFFLKDYLQVYCAGKLRLRTKSPVPTVGFCGQAASSPLRVSFRKMRILVRKLMYRAGKLKWSPPPFETTSFRRRLLKQFERQDRVRTNFLLREQYHAGNDQEKSEFSPQKLAFVNNILDSDYTVCMRGGGNYSTRFYETLSLGRIPVFIDTDCLLPFEDRIPYRQLFPWVTKDDLAHAAEIVAAFHARLSNDDFISLQHACRKLWEDHFTPNGFHADLQETIHELAAKS